MKILFIKLGAIGDIVQAAAAVCEFRRRQPDATLDWVVGRTCASLVSAFGVADNVLAIDDVSLFAGSLVRRGRTALKSLLQIARLGRYDRVITAYADPRYRVLSLGVIGAEKTQFAPRARRPSPIHHRSRVHEYWRLLSGGDGEALSITEATRVLGERLAGLTYPGRLPEKYIVLAAGGAKNLHRDDGLRRWPIASYRALAQSLVDSGYKVILVGAGTDQWVSDALGDIDVIDLIGKTTLLEVVAVLQGANAVVANDSGLLHLACVTNTGVVALFGPTPANAFIPRGRDRTIVLEEGNRVSCSPCYDGTNYARCSRNVCLEAISVDRVIEAVGRVLEPELHPGQRECRAATPGALTAAPHGFARTASA